MPNHAKKLSEPISQTPVEFTAGDQKWAVNSTATGSASRSGPFLTVVLDKHTMRVNHDYKFAPVKVVRYKIGLAAKNANGQWEVPRWSDTVQQGFLLSQGQTKLIENAKFTIPIDGLVTLKDRWLVLAVETETTGSSGVGSNYSHSALGLE